MSSDTGQKNMFPELAMAVADGRFKIDHEFLTKLDTTKQQKQNQQ